MDTHDATLVNNDALTARLHAWAERLKAMGLDGIASVLLDASAPVAPLGAQLLYVAQPTLGVFFSSESVGELARWLETSDGVAMLRRELAEKPGE